MGHYPQTQSWGPRLEFVRSSSGACILNTCIQPPLLSTNYGPYKGWGPKRKLHRHRLCPPGAPGRWRDVGWGPPLPGPLPAQGTPCEVSGVLVQNREWYSFPRWARPTPRYRTWSVEGKPDLMSGSHAPLAGTLYSEQPGQPSVTSFSFCPDLLHSAGQLFPQLWFPKGRDQVLLRAVFLHPPKPSPGSGPKEMSLCLLTNPSPNSLEQLLSSWTLLCSLFRGMGRG